MRLAGRERLLSPSREVALTVSVPVYNNRPRGPTSDGAWNDRLPDQRRGRLGGDKPGREPCEEATAPLLPAPSPLPFSGPLRPFQARFPLLFGELPVTGRNCCRKRRRKAGGEWNHSGVSACDRSLP